MATGYLTSDMEKRILKWMLNDSLNPANRLVQPIVVRLMDTNGDADTAGTEITADSYEEVDTFWAQNSTTPGVEFANTSDIEFNSLDSTSTIVVAGLELWDTNVNSPVRVAYAVFDTPQSVPATEPFIMSTGTVRVKLL